jgi:hypothetical protein
VLVDKFRARTAFDIQKEPGKLRDLSAVTRLVVGAQRGLPGRLGQAQDR